MNLALSQTSPVSDSTKRPVATNGGVLTYFPTVGKPDEKAIKRSTNPVSSFLVAPALNLFHSRDVTLLGSRYDSLPGP